MFSPSRPERVAIVHEWLVNHAGSEKVVEQLLQIYPQADLYAVVDFSAPASAASWAAGWRAPPSSSACRARAGASATTCR